MTTPAAWHPDPTGRHDHRWWDGERWTEHVADAGVAAIDPLDAPARDSASSSTDDPAVTTPDAADGPSEAGVTGAGDPAASPSDGTSAGGWADGPAEAAAGSPAAGTSNPSWEAPAQQGTDAWEQPSAQRGWQDPAQPGGAQGWQDPAQQGGAQGWQQPGAQQAWQQPGGQAAWQAGTGTAAGGGREGMALAAMILGLASLPLLIACGAGVLTGIVAIVLGFVAMSRAKRSGRSGRGMAITGIVAGVVAILIAVGVLVAFGGSAARYADCLQRTGDEAVCERELESELLGRFGL